MQILTRNRVAMNRWGGEEKGNLITSLVAVGSLAGGNKASGTKGTLCTASGRQIAKNAGALMVIQVFGGSFDICQVPPVQCESRKEHLERLPAHLWHGVGSVCWLSPIPRVWRRVVQKRGRKEESLVPCGCSMLLHGVRLWVGAVSSLESAESTCPV